MREIFFRRNFFWRIVKKTARTGQIRTRKNLVLHGMLTQERIKGIPLGSLV